MPRHNKFCFELFKIKHADFFFPKLIFITLLANIFWTNKIIKHKAKHLIEISIYFIQLEDFENVIQSYLHSFTWISGLLMAVSSFPQTSKKHIILALLTVKHLVHLTSVFVSILMAAATGSLPQYFLAVMKCGGWSSVLEDFELWREGI